MVQNWKMVCFFLIDGYNVFMVFCFIFCCGLVLTHCEVVKSKRNWFMWPQSAWSFSQTLWLLWVELVLFMTRSCDDVRHLWLKSSSINVLLHLIMMYKEVKCFWERGYRMNDKRPELILSCMKWQKLTVAPFTHRSIVIWFNGIIFLLFWILRTSLKQVVKSHRVEFSE